MRQLLAYLETNAILLCFSVAALLLIYTAGRFLKLPEVAAITLALAPFGLAWAYTGGLFKGIFF